jgi:thymidylate synthase (FAD)
MEKGYEAKVLDHGYVRLVDFMGSDESVIEAARMSTGKGFISWDPYQLCKKCGVVFALATGGENAYRQTQPLVFDAGGHYLQCNHDWEMCPNGDQGLLEHLWSHHHATPFEMCELAIEVQAPIFVFREWHRHRTQSYNEFSARYSQMQNLHYIPELTRIQKQSAANKQGSAEAFPEDEAESIRMFIEAQQEQIYESYDEWVEKGLAKEVARVNTPVSRYSKMRAKTDLRSWLMFLNLRIRPDAQWEIRQYAQEVASIIGNLFPRTWALFMEYDLYGTRFSRTEMNVLRSMLSRLMDPRTVSVLKSHADIFQALVDTDSRIKGKKAKEFVHKLKVGGESILT